MQFIVSDSIRPLHIVIKSYSPERKLALSKLTPSGDLCVIALGWFPRIPMTQLFCILCIIYMRQPFVLEASRIGMNVVICECYLFHTGVVWTQT